MVITVSSIHDDFQASWWWSSPLCAVLCKREPLLQKQTNKQTKLIESVETKLCRGKMGQKKAGVRRAAWGFLPQDPGHVRCETQGDSPQHSYGVQERISWRSKAQPIGLLSSTIITGTVTGVASTLTLSPTLRGILNTPFHNTPNANTFLADPCKARGCSTNTVVIHKLSDPQAPLILRPRLAFGSWWSFTRKWVTFAICILLLKFA